MLKRIKAKNFLSFKDEIGFDFTKTKNENLLDTNVNDKVVKGALIVGGNASGKSNTFKAIRFLIETLFLEKSNFSWYKNIFTNSNILQLEYKFCIEGLDYTYKLDIDVKNSDINEKIYIGEELNLERRPSECTLHGKTYQEIDKSTLFLRSLKFNGELDKYPKLKKLYDHLSEYMFMDSQGFIMASQKNFFEIVDHLDEFGTNKINELLELMSIPIKVIYEKDNIDFSMYESKKEIKEAKYNNLKILKKGNSSPLPFNRESLGNRNLLSMLPYILEVTTSNKVLFIDEFSNGFHNMLSELIVKYFYNNSPKESQLFIISHSTNLLSSSIFRADQIYMTDFKDETTHNYRFSQSKPRDNQSFERIYLNGMANGLPNYNKQR